MVLFTIREIIDLVILTVGLGYIFSAYISRPKTELELVYPKLGLSWRDFKFAIIVTAPAVILHELAHKFVAMGFGLEAVFKAWYAGLGIGVFLRVINSPLILLAPGYVQIPPSSSNLAIFMTAFAGPLTNLLLFGVAGYILTHAKKLTRNQAITIYLTKQINFFLFIFNMLPIPPLDGSKVFSALFQLIFA
ncbi:MAG: site-2 protease family protein [Candidatus Nanoarchaeia archaeon]|nr:site-2 protease family protein [Candidatus Nanoarchaeia archaeon]